MEYGSERKDITLRLDVVSFEKSSDFRSDVAGSPASVEVVIFGIGIGC
jgi:hypothetical protein